MLQSVKKLVGAGKTAPQRPKKPRPQLDRAAMERPVNEAKAKLDQARVEHDACAKAVGDAERVVAVATQDFDREPSEANESALLAARGELERKRLHADRTGRLFRQAELDVAGMVAARDAGITAYYEERLAAVPDEVRELWETKLKAAFEEVAVLLEELDQVYNEAHAAILELTRGNPELQFAKISGLNAEKAGRIKALARADIGYKTLERLGDICT